MKKVFYLMLTLLFLSAAGAKAQVNIGSLDNPSKGAVLDLSQVKEQNLGFLLPRVLLNSASSWDPMPEPEENGMMVFNINEVMTAENELKGKGVYVWMDDFWHFLQGGTGTEPISSELPGTPGDWVDAGLASGNGTAGNPYTNNCPGNSSVTITANTGFTLSNPLTGTALNSPLTISTVGSDSVKVTKEGKSGMIYVQVNDCTVPVSGVSLNKTSLTLLLNGSETLTATVAPANATNKAVNWSSSNETVATVSNNGAITTLSTGTATIIATTVDGGKTATCSLTVKPTALEGNPGDWLTTNGASGNGSSGSPYTNACPATSVVITAKTGYAFSNAVNGTISANTATFNTLGIGIVTVTNEDGQTSMVYASVVTCVESVSLNKTSLTLVASNSETLTATVLPNEAVNKNVTWSSSNATVATVTNGFVTAVSVGTATITVTTADGGKTADCIVTVTPILVSSITISAADNATSLVVGNTLQLSAAVSPANATNKAVTWSIISGNNYAEVSITGLVTAKAGGTVTVQAAANDESGETGPYNLTILSSGPGNTIIGNNGTYRTYCYPNGLGCWMIDNSKEGTPSAYAYSTYPEGALGYYYSTENAQSACPAGWSVPDRTQAANIVAYAWTTTSSLEHNQWWSSTVLPGLYFISTYPPALGYGGWAHWGETAAWMVTEKGYVKAGKCDCPQDSESTPYKIWTNGYAVYGSLRCVKMY